MQISLSIIWLIFFVLFFVFGLYHFRQSKRKIPPFPMPDRYDVIKDLVKISGFDPDELIRNFIADFNSYVNEQNDTSCRQNIIAACGYWLASIAAIVSMILEWREELSSLFAIIVSRFI